MIEGILADRDSVHLHTRIPPLALTDNSHGKPFSLSTAFLKVTCSGEECQQPIRQTTQSTPSAVPSAIQKQSVTPFTAYPFTARFRAYDDASSRDSCIRDQ